MADPSRAVMLFGTDEPPAETRTLTAGPLSVELDAGNLRYIRFGGREAIRAISYVVRDQFWGTFNPEISEFEVNEGADGFAVSYTATCKGSGQRFTYRARIEGKANGDLSFSATGAGETDFLTNRTGFVVLHAIEGVAGEPVTVEHVDGSTEETVFPARIDPDCPIRDIRALTHAVAPGVTVRCEMTGDTFEMEDQRNWTDASYKTYVRPLSLPHPYTLGAGEEITQAVTLAFDGAPPAAAAGAGEVTVTVGEQAGKVPDFGMWAEPEDLKAALDHRELVADLKPSFLSLYLDASHGVPEGSLGRLAQLGDLLRCPLALEAVIPGESVATELSGIATRAGASDTRFDDVAVSLAGDLGFVIPGTVFPDTKAFDRLFAAARATFPGARIGGGNFVYFTELNRKPVPTAELDFVLHGTSALVHAADDRSVTETIECLPHVFASCRAMIGDIHYRVSPAGIGSRTSPFGNAPTPNLKAHRVTMTRADPRQRGLLGAAWHLGYAAQAAASGVDSVALGTPAGPFGLVHAKQDYAQPWFDAEGGRYPVWHVMRALYAASGLPRRATTVSAPRDVQALCFDHQGTAELWLANLTGEPRGVRVEGFAPGRVIAIDETTFAACAHRPGALDHAAKVAGELRLAPYAVARLRA